MIILSFAIYGLLLKGQFFIKELELPLLEITLEFGEVFQYIYGFVIMVSIFTSAISAGYSFLENVSKDKKEYKNDNFDFKPNKYKKFYGNKKLSIQES